MVEATDRRRLRILFVAADVPWPPDGGGRIATLRNLQAFAAIGEVDLVALADPIDELDLTELRRLCRSVTIVPHPFTFGRHRLRQATEAALSLFSPWPYRLRKFKSRTFRRALVGLQVQGNYDLVHFDQFGVAPYWQSGTPSTYACQNVESVVYGLAVATARSPLTRLWSRQEARKLRFAEQRLLPRFDEVLVLAPEDATLLRQLGIQRTRLIPMPAPRMRQDRATPPLEPVILSLGTMSWFGVEEGLLWFRNEVYPLVRAAVPNVRWNLVGPNAGSALRQLDGHDGISLMGYVHDLDPVFDQARVAIVPLHIAGGIRMKLLDLMAAGVPAVSTTLGARGLAFNDGDGCLRRDDPQAFADAVIALLQDDDRWWSTVEGGRRYLEINHTPDLLLATVRSCVSDVLSRHPPAAAAR